jgi:uncharacterized membrane protein
MKLSWRFELVQGALIVAMFIVAAACWSHVPERMPIHWNLQGEVDGYGGKFVGLLLMPLVAAGLYLLLLFLPRIDPGYANYQAFAGVYNAIRLTLLLFLSVIYGVTVLAGLGYAINMTTVVGLSVAVLFVVLGSMMGRIRPNWFVGVRTPWTLSSKLSWSKTHRLAGWLFVAMGLTAVPWALLQSTWSFLLLVVVVATFSAWIVVYSYLVYRTDPDRLAPAGTSPKSN